MSGTETIDPIGTHVTVEHAGGRYALLPIMCLALAPALFIEYVFLFQDSMIQIKNHVFDGIAVCVASMVGIFIGYVAWRCYQRSGEPLVRSLTLGFLAFALVHALYGVITGVSHHPAWLVSLYGPMCRLTISVLFLAGLLWQKNHPDSGEWRTRGWFWLACCALFLAVDTLAALTGNSDATAASGTGLLIEWGALVVSALNVITLIRCRNRSPLMALYGISAIWFALSSVAYILGRPWNDMWWLAHGISAAGAFLVGFGIVQAFSATGTFARFDAHEAILKLLADATARTESTLKELKQVQQKLEKLAVSDPLTGASNRTHFIERVETEIARAKSDGMPFSLLALDLDNLQWINESYGIQTGDTVLQEFVQACREAVRPYEGVARVGGEEFMVLLPHAGLDAALVIGERIRLAIASTPFGSESGCKFSTTVSIGISQYGRDGNTIDTIFGAADRRRYRAKRRGRNCVVAV